MDKKTLVLGVSALALGGFFMYPKAVEAYQGNFGEPGPNCTGERHEAVTQAFENNDYNAWKEQMNGRGRVSEAITEDNFGRFAEAHKLASEGRTEEAAAIREELGLGLRAENGNGHRRGNRGDGYGEGRKSL